LKTITEHILFLKYFVEKGGPTCDEWKEVKDWMNEIGLAIEKGLYSKEEIDLFYNAIGNSFPIECIQGMTFHKPRGYSGDFELLNRIQTKYISQYPNLKKWDEYFHSCEAPQAVRYRIGYLDELLQQKTSQYNNEFCMLNVASGPCRDIFEYFRRHAHECLNIECVEHDQNAIVFANKLLKEINCKVVFYNTNILRFQFSKSYDLIWSAGLFDYLNDEIFCGILKRMLMNISPGGEIVIGNLSVTNPSKYYMLLFKWIVFHRTEDQLTQLAIKAGAAKEQISVYKEKLGVNLFLHIKSN
jgi:extracellular factor (EF) 3-hydroxypalmitic acid methyl ester biosynthesis protein